MKKLLIVVFSLMIFTACEAVPKRYSAAYTDVFDTVTQFTAYCGSDEEFEKYSDILHDELLRLHEIFDIYSTYGDMQNACMLNEKGSLENPPPELVELIESGKNWYSETGGQLNIALGSVLSLWHDCRENAELPDPDMLKNLSGHCDIEKISMDNGIALADPEMSLDFGALAKGYAAEKAAEKLIERGLENFAISCGGNVVTHGKKPSGSWEIGIENPDGGLITSVFFSGESVVTSGDYQRFVEIGGVRYHHIIDPKTLYPAKFWRSVTVISESSAEADALSTALFCMDQKSGLELIKKHSAEAMWIDQNGEVYRSEGFSDYE